MLSFYIRADEAEPVVEVTVLGYEFPGSESYWGANWLSAKVCARPEGFVADFPFSVRTKEVVAFLEELRSLYENLRGEARFDPYEGQITPLLDYGRYAGAHGG